jgi:hypothetical protein
MGFLKIKTDFQNSSWDKDNSVSYKIDPVLDFKEVHDIDQSSLKMLWIL